MEIIYNLNKKETAFLRALLRKTQPKNAWSGRMSDDAFREKWKKQINSFDMAGLTERKDSNLPDTYWEYGLNRKGIELQKKILNIE